jgi:hypothetical protein
MYSKRFGIEQINLTFEEFLSKLDSRLNLLPVEKKHDKISKLHAEKIIQI